RMKRELELASGSHGLSSSVKRKINFVAYFEAMTEEKKGNTVTAWKNTLKHLKDYVGDTLPFTKVTREWLAGFQTYLLSKVSANSSVVYFSKIKAAIRRAVKEDILDKNPCNAVPAIAKQDTHRAFLTTEELAKLAKTP